MLQPLQEITVRRADSPYPDWFSVHEVSSSASDSERDWQQSFALMRVRESKASPLAGGLLPDEVCYDARLAKGSSKMYSCQALESANHIWLYHGRRI